MFVTDEMLASAALETNLYSTQKCGNSINTSGFEIEQVLGIYLRMGLALMPNVRCYWEDYHRYHLVADIMPRIRFEKLMTSIHLTNNLTVVEADKSDKIWKIRAWLSCLRENYLKMSPKNFILLMKLWWLSR